MAMVFGGNSAAGGARRGRARFWRARLGQGGLGQGQLARRRLALALAAPGLALGQAALAQSSAPASTLPGSLPTREELERQPAATTPPPPRLKIHGEIESAPCPLDNPAYSTIRITVTKALFANLGPVPPEALADSYAQYIGTEQPISVVCRIRDAAATRLRAMGYIASVEVPVQRITNGEVRFQVLYARISAVRVVGQVGRSAGLFGAYLNRLADGRVFNRHRAERLVLLARDVPGYEVQMTLKPAANGVAGDMVAEVRLVRIPVEIDASLTDMAAPATGRIGAQVQAQLNDLLGLGDRTTLGVYTTTTFKKQQIYQLGEELRLGGSGLKLAGHLSYALTRPALAGVPQVRASTIFANAELAYPLVKRSAFALGLAAGLDVVDQNVTLGGLALSRDRDRVIYGRLDWSAIDLAGHGPGGAIGWRLAGDVELRHGVSIFGASPDCQAQMALCGAAGYVPPSLTRADPEATLVRAEAHGEWHPLAGAIFALGLRGQLANGATVAFEQFSLGNYTIGRGYAPGALTGDDGFAVSGEVKSVAFRLAPASRWQLQPYAFSDHGWAFTRGAPGPTELHSLGAGLRLDYDNRYHIDASVAAPLTRLPGEPKSANPLFLLTLSAAFQPGRTQ